MLFVHHTPEMVSGCVLSDDETHRFALWRLWDPSCQYLCMVLLNPSTADHIEPDPTVTRCIERARRLGFGGLVIVNSDAVRETDRNAAVKRAGKHVIANERWVRWMARGAGAVIVGWGPDAARFNGDSRMLYALAGLKLHALRINADGSPGHPLYIPYDAPLLPYVGW